jgi:hypothetical protein
LHTFPGQQTPCRRRVIGKALALSATVLLALGISALTGCGGQTSHPSAITISGPSSDTIDPTNSANFTATVTGGPLASGVSWSLTGCTVTNCGTLSNSTTTGVTYTAPTTVATAFTVSLTATSVATPSITQSVTLSVPVNPTITTPAGALPGATFGAAYTAALAATGGITPYTWTISQGALPAGLAISSTTGAITGSPTSAGTATFTVTLTDAGSPALTASAAFTLTTLYTPVAVTTTSLPNGVKGTAYSATLAATGGSGTGYTWSVISGTGLSAVGLTLTPTGAITGTPTAGETAGMVTVMVTDSAGNTARQTLSLTITYPTLTVTSLNPSSGVAGDPYTFPLMATGGSGTGYTWSVTSGNSSLSAIGLSLSSSGVVSGATPLTGTAAFTVQVTDSASNTATANLSVSITPGLGITTVSLPPGVEGTPYTATLTATGGSNTGYTWSVISGTGLSAVGLTLSPSGAITGTPTAGETAVPFTAQVVDSASNKATATLTLTVTSVAFQGQVLSGKTPVNGATIQLYAAGATGNMSTATPMLTQTVTSDPLGMFQLVGLYTCGQGATGQTIPTNAQLYLVATGGTTSTTSGTSNPALTMVTAVGPCSNLAPTTPPTPAPFTTLNELTTAAAAWALAPFASSATNLGATSTNTLGLTNAFLDAALLANPTTGAPATLPANLTVESAKLAALADALSTCATSCSALFTAATPPSGTTPTDTFTAALNIAHNPGQNVAAIFATIPATPPFATTFTTSPNDWTLSLTVTGGGLSYPTALGIDNQGNVWVADEPGPLSAFNPQGKPLSATGYGAGSISQVFGLAIDPSNNIWVTNQGNLDSGGAGYVTKFLGVNDPATQGTSAGAFGYVTNPVSIAADTNGNIYTANTGISSVTVYNSTGTLLNSYLGYGAGLGAGQNALAIDAIHSPDGFWISTNNANVAHFSSTGALLEPAGFCCSQSDGIATDSAGNLWIADYLGGANGNGAVAEAVTDSSNHTTFPISGLTTGGINYPGTAAIDAAQNVWFINRINGSVTELAGINNSLPVGTALSPSTGVYTTGGFGLDAHLGVPYSLLPDRSGNLWVSNEGLDTVTLFFGLAAPTITPLQPVPTAP